MSHASSPAVTALVFDMDGLMLDTEPTYRTAWQRAAAELGFTLDDHTYEAFIGRRTEDCERELAERLGPTFAVDRFAERWPVLWRELSSAEGIAAKPGLYALLEFAAAHGLATAVATSSDRDFTDFTLQCGGLVGRFTIIVTGDQIANGKPAPDIYLEAARRVGQPPAQCMAFEDSDAGILAASRAGMRAVMVPDLKPPSPAATASAFRILRSLTEAPALISALGSGAQR